MYPRLTRKQKGDILAAFLPANLRGAGTFLLKQQALLNMAPGDVLVRETQLDPERWHYQLLIANRKEP